MAFGRKQFRELFSPTWATSVCEAIGALRRRIPSGAPKKQTATVCVLFVLFCVNKGFEQEKQKSCRLVSAGFLFGVIQFSSFI